MKPRTPYLYDALVFLGCALLLAIKALDAHTFGMITVALVGVRVGVSAGKRATAADVESGRLRLGTTASDRPPPPSDPNGAAGGRSSSSSEPPKLPPTSAALAIVGAIRSTGVAGAATALVVLVLLVLFGFGGSAALAGR